LRIWGRMGRFTTPTSLGIAKKGHRFKI
jgi:hypothetical protein